MCSLRKLLERFSAPYEPLSLAEPPAPTPTRLTRSHAWDLWHALRHKPGRNGSAGEKSKELLFDYMGRYTKLRYNGWSGTLPCGLPLHLATDDITSPVEVTLRVSLSKTAVETFEKATRGVNVFSEGPAREYPEAWGSAASLEAEVGPDTFVEGPPEDTRRLVVFLKDNGLAEPLVTLRFNGARNLFLSRSFGRYDYGSADMNRPQHLQVHVVVTPSFKELDLCLEALDLFVQRLEAVVEAP